MDKRSPREKGKILEGVNSNHRLGIGRVFCRHTGTTKESSGGRNLTEPLMVVGGINQVDIQNYTQQKLAGSFIPRSQGDGFLAKYIMK